MKDTFQNHLSHYITLLRGHKKDKNQDFLALFLNVIIVAMSEQNSQITLVCLVQGSM